MADFLLVLQLAIELAFALLAIRTAASWARQPSRRNGYLALALGALAMLVLLQPAMTGSNPTSQLVVDLTAALFLASGYGLAMFRDTFVPFRPSVRLLIRLAIVAVGLLALVARLPANPSQSRTPLQSLLVVAIVLVWSACLVEPIARFWLASRGAPAVESARLRALCLGYAGLLIVVVVGSLTTSAGGQVVTLLIDLFTLATLPVLYIAFFPPAWLRRVWWQPEEDQLRRALHDLLLYSPDRQTLAQRALGWAARLVGGDAAFVIDSDGSVLASRHISPADAAKEADAMRQLYGSRDGHTPLRTASTVMLPLDLQNGRGAIVIATGRLAPLFGDDEVNRLQQYASSITAGLERVALTARVQALERAKSEFLNVASHELRGPMTVIKGYLTMLEAGSLGELPARASSVLPLLISKSDEVNWMLEQMVEASRLEEGRLALKKRRLDIVELVRGAVEGVKMLVTGHDLNVIQRGTPVDAEVDPDRYQIVVRNLLTNAAKYSPPGTEIKIDVRRDEGSGVVTVTDRGAGISQENQAHLFTRFGRIESTQHVHGTGLGLWLSREIARMHDGDLTVHSEVGQGSTFEFTVPLTN